MKHSVGQQAAFNFLLPREISQTEAFPKQLTNIFLVAFVFNNFGQRLLACTPVPLTPAKSFRRVEGGEGREGEKGHV